MYVNGMRVQNVDVTPAMTFNESTNLIGTSRPEMDITNIIDRHVRAVDIGMCDGMFPNGRQHMRADTSRISSPTHKSDTGWQVHVGK